MKLAVGDRVRITNFKHAYVTRHFEPYGTIKAIRKKDGTDDDFNVMVAMDEICQETGTHYVLCFNDKYLVKI